MNQTETDQRSSVKEILIGSFNQESYGSSSRTVGGKMSKHAKGTRNPKGTKSPATVVVVLNRYCWKYEKVIPLGKLLNYCIPCGCSNFKRIKVQGFSSSSCNGNNGNGNRRK